jgi:hypothetical protein
MLSRRICYRRRITLNPSGNLSQRQDLYGEQWILAYEASIKGWLSPALGGDNVASDPRFSILKDNGVAFYDEQKVEDAFAQAADEEEAEEPEVEEGYFS